MAFSSFFFFFLTNMELNRSSTCHRLDCRTLINKHPLVQTDLAAHITHPPQHVTEVLAYFVRQRFLSLRAAALRLSCFMCRGTQQQHPTRPVPPRRVRWRDRSVILTSWGERYRCIKWHGRKHQGRVLASSFVGMFIPSGCRHRIHLPFAQKYKNQRRQRGTNHKALLLIVW